MTIRARLRAHVDARRLSAAQRLDRALAAAVALVVVVILAGVLLGDGL